MNGITDRKKKPRKLRAKMGKLESIKTPSRKSLGIIDRTTGKKEGLVPIAKTVAPTIGKRRKPLSF